MTVQAILKWVVRMEDPAVLPPTTQSARIILLVEDEVVIRMAIADALREQSYLVVEAANADEALDMVEAGIHPDVLFTDVRMPGAIDGLELAQRLKPRFPGLVVMVASGHAAPQEATSRAFKFFSKPYDINAVVDAIGRELDQGEQ